MIDELGRVELTNEEIEPHCLEQVSAGQVVKAMILNALGFLSAPLYLFSEFFESKAVSHLDKTVWPAQKLLKEYNGQQTVERGFRFLKDPLFFGNRSEVHEELRVPEPL